MEAPCKSPPASRSCKPRSKTILTRSATPRGTGSILRFRAVNITTGTELAAKEHSDAESYTRELKTLQTIAQYRMANPRMQHDYVVELRRVDELERTLYLDMADGDLARLVSESPGGVAENQVKPLVSQMLRILCAYLLQSVVE